MKDYSAQYLIFRLKCIKVKLNENIKVFANCKYILLSNTFYKL